MLDESLKVVSDEIRDDMTEDEALDLILKLTVSSYTQKLVCNSLLQKL
jgi:hypothetical protein